ncbi:MAG: hypothetical protein HW398_1002 [Acidobacteria bacterium]|nr:hypothetical protein [Acidobacteriota bacterium]
MNPDTRIPKGFKVSRAKHNPIRERFESIGGHPENGESTGSGDRAYKL